MKRFLMTTAAVLMLSAPAFASPAVNSFGGSVGGATFGSFSVAGGGSIGTGGSAGSDQAYASFTGANNVGFNGSNFNTSQSADAQTGSQFNENSYGNGAALAGGVGVVTGATGEGGFASFARFPSFSSNGFGNNNGHRGQ